MNRRNFIQRTSAAALGGLLFTACDTSGDAVRESSGLLPTAAGVQLYTVRELLQDDFYATLEEIAALGYEELEFAGLFDHVPEEVREHLNSLGLRSPATHISLMQLENDFDGVVEEAQALGQHYVVVPSLSEDDRASLEDYRRVADRFNELGEELQAEGLQLGYHNHAFEFERFDDGLGYDVLLEETDPSFVTMEMDLYWVVEAGEDPLDYIDRYPGRFALFHVKDRTEEGEMVAVGEGAIDFEAIFARAEEAGLEHAFVEHDNPESPLSSIETSINHLTA